MSETTPPQPPEHHPSVPATSTGEKPGATRPAIYVASLADYNAGRLHGTWLAADQDPEELQAATEAMLATSPEPDAEEWAIHDHDNFSGLQIDEHTSFATVSNLAYGLRTYGPAFAAYANWLDDHDISYASFEQSYAGHWEQAEDYVTESIDADAIHDRLALVLPDWVTGYVRLDLTALARDLELAGDLHIVPDNDGVHVFERPDD